MIQQLTVLTALAEDLSTIPNTLSAGSQPLATPVPRGSDTVGLHGHLHSHTYTTHIHSHRNTYAKNLK